MEMTVLRDVRRFVLDTDKAQRSLEKLRSDCAAWARDREALDVAALIEYANRLEVDVCQTLAHYVPLDRQYCDEGDGLVLNSIHRAFANLNVLFDDLKKVRRGLKESYVHTKELKRLEIDLGRLRKSIGQLQKHLGAWRGTPPAE